MNRPPVDPDVADAAPNEPALTAYDEQHVVTYIRLLQAEGEGTDWREVSALDGIRRAARDPRMFAHMREFLRMRRAVALTEIYGW